MNIRRAVSPWVVACLCALASGCSVTGSFDQARDAAKAIREGDEAVGEGEYEAGINAYLKARKLLLTARQNEVWIFSGDAKLSSLEQKMLECERLKDEDGFIRVGEHYVQGDELGTALTAELRRMFRENPAGLGTYGPVIPDELEASCIEGPDGRYDVRIMLVLRDGGDSEAFDQDAWVLVRFLMQGGWGYGFSFTTARRFGPRSYMGNETGWGRSGRAGAENCHIGLTGRIDRLTVNVDRGQSRKEPGDGYGARGFRSLEAVGPYWRRDPYRSYTMTRADAERLNWMEAGRIPDATLYGLIVMTRGPVAMPGATAEVGIR